MSLQRNRERQVRVAAGQILYDDWSGRPPMLIYEGSYLRERHMCIDYTDKEPRKTPPILKGNMPATPWEHKVYTMIPAYITGESLFMLKQWPADVNQPPDLGIHYRPPWDLGRLYYDSGLALQMLSDTNPYRADFSVPTFIRELVDVGDMFKLAAKSFAKFVGGTYLNYRFGWKSFVQDVRTLARITTSIQKRMDALMRLHKHGGLVSNWKGPTFHWQEENPHYQINSTWYCEVYAYMRRSSIIQIKGSCRWAMVGDITDSYTKLKAFNDALTNCLDLEELDGTTLWNTIPWSWFTDWLIDFGSWFGANEGPADLKCYDICINWHVEAEETHQPLANPRWRVTNGHQRAVVNSRSVIYDVPYPIVRTDFLSVGQWEVVLALLTKFVKR